MTPKKIKITLQNSGTEIECPIDHSSLLEALENQNIDVEYQCREGYCGACRARLVKGKVHYFQKPLASLREDDILLCSCRASEDVEIIL